MLITFDDLQQQPTRFAEEQQEICIRGFLYPLASDIWVLAPQPNLKSCCLQKPGQVLVKGLHLQNEPWQAVTVKGKLEWNSLQGYVLEQPQLLTSSSSFPMLGIGGALLVVLAAFYKWLRP